MPNLSQCLSFSSRLDRHLWLAEEAGYSDIQLRRRPPGLSKEPRFSEGSTACCIQRDLLKHLSCWRAAADKRRVESFGVAAWWRKRSTKCSAVLPLTCDHSCWSCLWLEHPAAACRILLLHTDSLELCVASPTLQLLCVSGTISEGCFFPPPIIIFYYYIKYRKCCENKLNSNTQCWRSYTTARFVKTPRARFLYLYMRNVWLVEEI